MVHPQMPPLTEAETEAFLKEAPIVRLCSKNADGTVHVAPVWFTYEGGEFHIGTQDSSRKAKNIRRDGDVTLLIDNQNPPYKGIVVYGKASLDHVNVIEKRVSIFRKYMPENEGRKMAEGLASRWKPVVIHVKPTKTASYDYSKGRM